MNRHLLPLLSLLGAAFTAQAANVTVRVLDRQGQPLPNAVVMLDTSAPGPRPTPPTDAVVNQEKMRFIPAISVVPVGARVTFSNSDAWDHHLRGGLVGPGGVYLDAAQGFELRLAARTAGKAAPSAQQTFAKPGPYLLGCHIHSSMRGYVYASDTPWAGVTGADGQAVLAAVPSGAARVRVWVPEQLSDPAPLAVQVADGMAAITVSTQATAPRRRVSETPTAPYQDTSRQ